MATETRALPINYAELPPQLLLARLRDALINDTRLAVAELANHLPAENQAELRMPPQENISHIQVVVSSPDRKRYFRVIYFIQPQRYPIKSYFEVQPRNKIVIEEGKSWHPGQSTWQSSDSWESWHGMPSKLTVLWERGKEQGITHRVYNLDTTRSAIYQNNRLTEGDPTLLQKAAEALESAFQVTGSRVNSLEHIERIMWSTDIEPEKPEPPSGGGKRVRQAQKELVPIPISIPL